LGLDVVNDDAAVVFVFDFRGDFAVDDFVEKGFGHFGFIKREEGGRQSDRAGIHR